jgi:hypothetical protein
MGRLREEEMTRSVGMREGDQRWLVLWFGRRSWERWVVWGGCSGVLLEKKKWSCGLGEGERPWLRGRRFSSCEGKKGVGFVFQGSGGLEKMIGNGV